MKPTRFISVFAAVLTAFAATLPSAAAPRDKHLSPTGHFTWGAEIGGGIDLGSNDMSTVNIDAFFGYRNSWIDILGIGAEIQTMVNDSDRAFPVYAVFRSNFRSSRSLCFLDARIGCVFNNLADNVSQTSFFCSPGIGINLAGGKSFQSYVTLSYLYNGIKPYATRSGRVDIDGLHMAVIRLGIAF